MTTGGSAPFGFDVVDGGRLVENEREQRAIRRIEAYRAEGLSIGAIVERLGLEGVEPRGRAWSKSTVHRVLQRAA